MPAGNSFSPCTAEQVAVFCSSLGFSLSNEQSACLAAYLNLLVKWNKAMNLVGRLGWEDILGHLAADSFHLAGFILSLHPPEEPECWDLGAGGGLPGIPLRMLWKQGSYWLVEAREKRALFLRTFLASHPLPGVSAFQGRAEAFMPTRPHADIIVSRAFMPWEKVLDLVRDFTAPGGRCLFLTLAPLPARLPRGWTAEAEKRYMIGCSPRFFWSIRRC